MRSNELVVLHEHPEWQKPLFAALERRGIAYAPYNLTRAAFSTVEAPSARLYFNQASPSAYVRGNTRAVPLALAYMRTLERLGARVLNGADVFALELSKSAQATLLHTLGIDTPWTITFNDVGALRTYADRIQWPAILKPDQGGSGARIHVVESLAHVESILAADPSLWLPDNLFLLQEYLPHDTEQGIVRLEFLGGELLYAMRVKTHGRFNLCPSPVCNPDEGDGACDMPAARGASAPGRVLSVRRRAARGRRDVRRRSCAPHGWMSAASSIWKRRTADAFSTTSTPIPTCDPRWPLRSGSTPSSGSWIFSRVNSGVYSSAIHCEGDSTGDQVYVQPYPQDGRRFRLSPGSGSSPQWSADGKTVYFTRIDNQVIAVDVARVGGDLRPGVARELFVAPGTFDHRSVLADTARKRFLVPVPHEQVTAGIDVVLNWQALLKGN